MHRFSTQIRTNQERNGNGVKNIAAKSYGNPVSKKKKLVISPVQTMATHAQEKKCHTTERQELKIISDTVTKAPETSGKRKVPKFNVKNGKNQCLPGTKQQQKILTSSLEEKSAPKSTPPKPQSTKTS